MEVKKPFILSSMKPPLLDTNSKVKHWASRALPSAAVGNVARLGSEATTAQAAPQPDLSVSGRMGAVLLGGMSGTPHVSLLIQFLRCEVRHWFPRPLSGSKILSKDSRTHESCHTQLWLITPTDIVHPLPGKDALPVVLSPWSCGQRCGSTHGGCQPGKPPACVQGLCQGLRHTGLYG